MKLPTDDVDSWWKPYGSIRIAYELDWMDALEEDWRRRYETNELDNGPFLDFDWWHL